MENSKKLAEKCITLLDLESVKLSKSYYYSSLPLCVIDSVFSIGVKYQSTINVVDNFSKAVNISTYREFGSDFSDVDAQYTVSDYLEFVSDKSPEYLSEEIFDNRQRTSTRNGVLKSVAVNQFMKVLESYKVNVFQDMNEVYNRSDFERDIRAIKGQKSGLSLNYFFMLAGSDQYSKPDRMVLGFIEDALGKRVDVNNASFLIKEASQHLEKEYPNLTPRLLDHAIWNYQRSK